MSRSLSGSSITGCAANPGLATEAVGAILDSNLKPSDPSDTDLPHGDQVGSFLVVEAESADEVWERLEEDAFYTSGEVVRIHFPA